MVISSISFPGLSKIEIPKAFIPEDMEEPKKN